MKHDKEMTVRLCVVLNVLFGKSFAVELTFVNAHAPVIGLKPM